MDSAIKVIRGAGLVLASGAIQNLIGPTLNSIIKINNHQNYEEKLIKILKQKQEEIKKENIINLELKNEEELNNDNLSTHLNNEASEYNDIPLSKFTIPEIQKKSNLLKKSELKVNNQSLLGNQSKERKVPATNFGRAMGFAGLGASLAYNMAKDSISSFYDNKSNLNNMMSERSAETLAAGLCRMRGAALKLGQMLSIQDETVIPPHVQAALDRVRSGADYMPRHQLENVLKNEWGENWHMQYKEFDFVPMAAASIGQVHTGILKNGQKVAIKVQYPGVAQSIESDMENLLTLMKVTDIIPKGLYIETVVKVMKKELKLECNYRNEMENQIKFKKLIEEEKILNKYFKVPEVYPELCTTNILTSEYVPGISINKVSEMTDDIRNALGTRLLHMTLKELFEWRFMQTDPNWGNFLYDVNTDTIYLIDFGATREFKKSFVDNYLKMVLACSEQNRQELIYRSQQLGFLTGDENKMMLDAHCEAGFIVGKAFANDGDYDFGQHSKLTPRVTELGSVMLKHRLCPPPEDSYSLHRKLSGAFLCCMKLRAIIPSKQLFRLTFENYKFDD